MQQITLKRSKMAAWCCSILLSLTSAAHALESRVVSDQLQAPWALAQVPDSQDILISEKAGRILRFNLSTRQLDVVSVIDQVKVQGQGGLMDVAIAPDFASSGQVFFSYAKALEKGSATTLARAVLDRSIQPWRLLHWQDLLVSQPASDSGRHFGSRIAFDNQGHVFFSVGDRGEREDAQNLATHTGSILRLNLDGSVPSDNPFSAKAGALPEIYSYGHRNPQGLAYLSSQQQLYAIEHGPRGGDEINLIESGANYGWPIISYGKEYWGPIAVGEGTARAGMQQPLMQYTPSIAPASLIYYEGDYFKQFQGSFLAGALAARQLSQVRFKAPLPLALAPQTQAHTVTALLENKGRRIRDVQSLEDGRLILISDRGELILLSQ